jgi:hypothetical protein
MFPVSGQVAFRKTALMAITRAMTGAEADAAQRSH